MTSENNLSCLDKSLQLALSQQIDEQCEKIRNECLSRLAEKVQRKVRQLEAEHASIVTNEIAEKAESLSKKFIELEKQYESAIDERRIIESSSKTGLRISQLQPRVEQMDPRSLLQKAVQGGMNYAKAVTEIQQLLKEIKNANDELDEVKTKSELAKNDKDEFEASLNVAKLKLQRETENLAQKEKKLSELYSQMSAKTTELEGVESDFREIALKNKELQECIA